MAIVSEYQPGGWEDNLTLVDELKMERIDNALVEHSIALRELQTTGVVGSTSPSGDVMSGVTLTELQNAPRV